MAELTREQKDKIVDTKIKAAKESYEKPIQQEIRKDYSDLAKLLDEAAAKEPAMKKLADTAREMAGVDHHDRTYDRTYNTKPEGRGLLARLVGAEPGKEEAAFAKEYDTRAKEDVIKAALGETGDLQKNTKIPADLKLKIEQAFKETQYDQLKITKIELFSPGTTDDLKRISASKTPQELDVAIKTQLADLDAKVRGFPKDISEAELQRPTPAGTKDVTGKKERQ